MMSPYRNLLLNIRLGGGVTNSCAGSYVGPIKYGMSYNTTGDISWGGFESIDDTFRFIPQGYVVISDEVHWDRLNVMTNFMWSYYQIENLIKKSPSSGSIHINFNWTENVNKDVAAYQLACRTDYSDGKGWIQYSDFKITPLLKYGQKVFDDNLFMNNYIEN